jgi:hypothetical protein
LCFARIAVVNAKRIARIEHAARHACTHNPKP